MPRKFRGRKVTETQTLVLEALDKLRRAVDSADKQNDQQAVLALIKSIQNVAETIDLIEASHFAQIAASQGYGSIVVKPRPSRLNAP